MLLRDQPAGARIEGVADSVPEDVERDRRDQKRQAREQHVPPGFLEYGWESAIIDPQSAVGGGMPTPRYESVASATMLKGINSDA